MELKNLEEKSLVDLKALIYDLMVESQKVNRDLQLVNQAIANKEVEPIKEESSE